MPTLTILNCFDAVARAIKRVSGNDVSNGAMGTYVREGHYSYPSTKRRG